MLNTDDIESAAPRSKPYKLSDGAGLILLLMPDGKKYWRVRYRLNGKEQLLSAGVFPQVSIEEARNCHAAIRQQLRLGLDPSLQRRNDAATQRQTQIDQEKAARFLIDSKGGLSLRMGKVFLELTPEETHELRHFLDTTRNVSLKA